ncbi:hint-domain-containing protein [Xylaria venustula]|nr:hint-domain-containing protein [Xylaria venustula]
MRTQFPMRNATQVFDHDDPVTTIHPLESKDGVLVRVRPPMRPSGPTLGHVPCDIVLVIDVSSSMDAEAPTAMADNQGNSIKEHFGLTVLDLTKHAARTILSSLNEGDRLGIVTFGYEAQVVQELTSMTESQKKEVDKKVDNMQVEGATNLWAGITKGLALFESGGSSGRVPALMVLTDGQPNHMCPPQGYVNKLRTMGALPASINTFGFGYSIRSGLLKSIAEACGGNYAFIPDAGMIGTVFVHAIAHLISTYATRCTLEITTPEGVALEPTTGQSINDQQHGDEGADYKRLTLQLGNLQYGQTRDIYLRHFNASGQQIQYTVSDGDRTMHTKLTYSRLQSPEYVSVAEHDMLEPSPLSPSAIAYHQSRSAVCDLLSWFTIIKDSEYLDRRRVTVSDYQMRLQELINNIPSRNYQDKHNNSLMEDLNGQITEALSSKEYFDRWGRHYFFSLKNAHEKQLCNTFKDPGPLMYNSNPYFTEFRDKLDELFNNIPPPKPSNMKAHTTQMPESFSMMSYNSQHNPCFAASSPVLLASGETLPISMLRKGMLVQTPLGSRPVRALLETPLRCGTTMCRVGELLVTPWHPIKLSQSEAGWVFPADVTKSIDNYWGSIYSVMLEPDGDAEAHAIHIGGVWGVTLGHGIVDGRDARAHEFWGDYKEVSAELVALGSSDDGVYRVGGVKRTVNTGYAYGFECLPSDYVNDAEMMDRVELQSKAATSD